MDREREVTVGEDAQDRYWVSCLHCGEIFDAASGAWCVCITDCPTVICPHCDCCLCHVGLEARLKFWQAAPPVMWQRRLRRVALEGQEPPSELGNPIRRPLILVVDDDKDTRRIAYHVLQALGYGVLLAEDGLQGFQLAKKFHPDLVLTDEVMPHLAGKHLCRAIKEDPDTLDIRVIVMSGLYKRDSQRIEIMKQFRAYDFLTKPIAYERLAEVLSSWLSAA